MDADKEAQFRINTLVQQRNDALAVMHNQQIEIAVLQARLAALEKAAAPAEEAPKKGQRH